MFFFRLPHHVLVNFSAVLQHEIVLTFKYVTLVTLCFSSDFPALALSPPVHTHTVRDFQPILWNRTVFLFLFFAYRTGCKNLKNQKSPQRTNLIPSRKKFYLLNQLCSFRCAKVRKEWCWFAEVSKNPTRKKRYVFSRIDQGKRSLWGYWEVIVGLL